MTINTRKVVVLGLAVLMAAWTVFVVSSLNNATVPDAYAAKSGDVT